MYNLFIYLLTSTKNKELSTQMNIKINNTFRCNTIYFEIKNNNEE